MQFATQKSDEIRQRREQELRAKYAMKAAGSREEPDPRPDVLDTHSDDDLTSVTQSEDEGCMEAPLEPQAV